jgi:hypothetical protein
MATIHITEIQRMLAERGEKDALPWASGGYFLELRFDDHKRVGGPVDEELKNVVITAECPYGSVTIMFDELGQLRSVDLS